MRNFIRQTFTLLCALLPLGSAYAEEEAMKAVPEMVQETAPAPQPYYPESGQAQTTPLMQPIRSVQEQKIKANSSVSLMADASLIIPISLIARDFSRKYHVPVALEFGSTKEQVSKLLQGAEANVFISAQPLTIKKLQNNGLIDVYSRTNITRNALVIAAPKNVQPFELSVKNRKQNIAYFPTNNEDFKFGFADAQLLTEGSYVIESFSMLDLDKNLKLHYSLFKDIDSMAHAIEEFGFYGAMYRTDTYLHPKLYAASLIPEKTHSPIIYQAVVVAGEHMDEARRFIAHLKTPQSQAIFTRFGFMDVASK